MESADAMTIIPSRNTRVGYIIQVIIGPLFSAGILAFFGYIALLKLELYSSYGWFVRSFIAGATAGVLVYVVMDLPKQKARFPNGVADEIGQEAHEDGRGNAVLGPDE